MTNNEIIINQAIAHGIYTKAEAQAIVAAKGCLPIHTFAEWKKAGYRSPVGILKIVRQPDGTFGLCHNETVWEACDTPQAEADNVFCHVTGCDEWDSCPDAGPSDLSEWEYIPS